MGYGVPFIDRANANLKGQPEPTSPTLRVGKDGFAGKPTFVIDSNRKRITIVWNELEEDIKLREQAKKLGLPQVTPSPASDGVIVQFLPEQISAIQVDVWSIMTFSLFPKMGTAFISQQSLHGLKNSVQISTFARCEYSWSNPR